MTRAETNEANMSDTELEPSDTQTTSDVVPAKIAVVLLTDLENWQKLNVTAFTISGVASQEGAVGEDYHDASGNRYLPMFQEPVLVFGASPQAMSRTAERARSRGDTCSVFTRDPFNTFNASDTPAAAAALTADRTSVVQGKSVAVRVELGGRR